LDFVVGADGDFHGDDLARAGVQLAFAHHQVTLAAHFDPHRLFDRLAYAQLQAHVVKGQALAVEGLRHQVAHVFAGDERNVGGLAAALLHGEFGRAGPGLLAGFGHPVHQVVNVHHVAGGEHAGHVGLKMVVHKRAAGDRVDLHPGQPRQFVLRDQADRQQ